MSIQPKEELAYYFALINAGKDPQELAEICYLEGEIVGIERAVEFLRGETAATSLENYQGLVGPNVWADLLEAHFTGEKEAKDE